MSSGSTNRPGAYPLMLDTKNSNGKPERNNPSSASTGGSAVDRSRSPPGPLEAGKSLSSKRPANSPINSSTEKRPRINGDPDKGKSASTGSPAATKQGATSTVTDATLSRHPSAENMINASRDPRKQGRGPAGSASPKRTASPFALNNSDTTHHGSGRNTPVSGAPTAPPMVPSSVPFPPKRPLGNELPAGVASIRQAAAKKQMQTVAASETAAIAQLRAKMIDNQNQNKKDLDLLKQNLAKENSFRQNMERKLDERLEKSRTTSADSDLLKKVSELSEKVQQLEASHHGSLKDESYINALVTRVKQSLPPSLPPELDIARVKSDLEKRMQRIETDDKSVVEKHLQRFENSIQSEMEKRWQSYLKKMTDLEAELNALRKAELPTKITSNLNRIDFLEDRMNDVERNISTSVEETLQVKLADVKQDFINQSDVQKQSVGQLIKDMQSEMSGKSTTEQLDALRSELVVVRDTMNNHVQAKSAAFSEQITTAVQGAKDYTDKEISKISKITVESAKAAQTYLEEVQTSVNGLANNLESKSAALENDVEQLQDRVKDVEVSTSNSISQLKANLSRQTEVTSRTDSEIDQIRVEFQSRVPSVRSSTTQPQASHLQNQIDELVEDVRNWGGQIDSASRTAESARNLAKSTGLSLIEETQKKFEGTLDGRLADIWRFVHAMSPPEKLQSRAPTNESRTNAAAYDTRITALEKKLDSSKQQFDSRMDQLTMTYQHIEARMQNMTTEDQYARMMDWVLSTYPNAPNFLEQFNDLRREVGQYTTFVQGFEWLRGEERSKQIMHLAEHLDSFGQFLEAISGSNFESIRDLVADNQTLHNNIRDLKAESDSRQERVQNIEAHVDHDRVRVDRLEEQVNTLVRLSGDVDDTKRDLRQLQDWKATFTPRVDVIESTCKEHDAMLRDQQKSITSMRLNVTGLMVTVFEHQEAILTVNNNLRDGGLKLKFSQQFTKTDKT